MVNKFITSIVIAILTINIAFSQFTYPISTSYKGDTVVFLTMKQVRYINSLLDNQNKKIQIEYVTVVTKVEKIDSLTKVIYKHKTVVDSIKIYDSIKVVQVIKKIDSLKTKLDTAVSWINKIAATNSFMYLDYCTNKIVVIDLNENNYIGYFNPFNGNLTFARNKTNTKNKLDNYMFLNPNRIYNKNKRPKVKFYPYNTSLQK